MGSVEDQIAISGINYGGLVNLHVDRDFAFTSHNDRDQREISF